MVYKLLCRNTLPIKPITPRLTLLLVISTLGYFTSRYTTHGTSGFMSYQKDEASWLSILLKNTCTCNDWVSNPHSADQKHHSLNLVLLYARPQHFTNYLDVLCLNFSTLEHIGSWPIKIQNLLQSFVAYQVTGSWPIKVHNLLWLFVAHHVIGSWQRNSQSFMVLGSISSDCLFLAIKIQNL